MPVSSVTEHWIKQDALTINLNHFGDPDYLQVSVLAGAVVMAFKQDVIGYNAAHNYRTWPLEAANTYLETSSAYNVYARLTRSEVNARALVIYDSILRDIEGREITYAEDGSETLGEPNPDFYYVFLGQVSESIDSSGQSKQREWTIDFNNGTLDTNQQVNDTNGLLALMFRPHYDNPLNPNEITWIEALTHLGVAGGMTTYANGGNLNIPDIYDGLPIDWSTIYWEEVKDADGNVTGRVLKAAGGGGSGEGGDVVVSGITVEQLAAYLSSNKYATQPWVEGKGYLTAITSAMVTGALGFTPFDAASFTKANIKNTLGIADWALMPSKPSYTFNEISGLGDELAKYIPISGYTEILGEKNFTGGLKVNGCPLVYDATNKYWKLEGDLLVTGGVTTHASDSDFKPSTIMDALLLDSTTLGINDNGQLYVKGGTGGLTEVHWSDVIGRPTKLSQFTDDVVAGKYLPLSGGTLRTDARLVMQSNVTTGNYIGSSAWQIMAYSNSFQIKPADYGTTNFSGGLTLSKGGIAYNDNILLHSSNYSDYALPYTGGRLSNSATCLFINRTTANTYPHITFESQGKPVGDIGVSYDGTKPVWYNYKTNTWNGIITSDNYSSYALPLTGGIIKGSSDTPLQIKSPIYGFVGLNLFTDETLALHLGYWDKLGGVRFENLRNQSKSGIGVLDNGLVVQYSYDDSYNFTKNKIWHEGNDGSGSGLDADLLDGKHNGELSAIYLTHTGISDANTFGNLGAVSYCNTISPSLSNIPSETNSYQQAILSIGLHSTSNLQAQFYMSRGHNLYYRSDRNGGWGKLAFTTDNVSSATKLKTARTIWGQSFDGTGNVDGDFSLKSSITNPVTLSTSATECGITFRTSDGGNRGWVGFSNVHGVTLYNYKSGSYGIDLYDNGNVAICPTKGNVGIGTDSPSVKLDVVGNIQSTDTMYSSSFGAIGDSSKVNLPNINFYDETKYIGFHISYRLNEANKPLRIYYRPNINTFNQLIDINANGNIGIGTTSPSQKLHVNGNILGHAIYFANGTTYYLGSTGNINCLGLTANGATTLKSTLGVTGAVTMESNLLVKGHVTSYSQRSLKNVIDERGLSLEELVTIKPTRYTWKDERDKLVHIGGIADDVQKVLPEVVFDNNGTLTMDYAMAGFAIAASLIKPVAKHKEDIESLKKRIKELELEVERLTMN